MYLARIIIKPALSVVSPAPRSPQNVSVSRSTMTVKEQRGIAIIANGRAAFMESQNGILKSVPEQKFIEELHVKTKPFAFR